MTVYEEVETRRPSVGTKVLVLACTILAVLGSFWAIVWFIRAYVEPPRVMRPAPMTLAASESTPVAISARASESMPAPTPVRASESTPAPTPARASGDAASVSVTQAQAASGQPVRPATAQFKPRQQAEQPASDALADRWAPIDQLAPPPAMAAPSAPEPVATESSPAAAAVSQADPDGVVEASVPAIEGRAPLPRRKPVMTAQRRTETPLPRPRPEAAGAAQPPSTWTAVPTADDRYPGQ